MIDVGDAVLSFIGDTTDLDRAYAKVAAGTDAAVKPGTIAVKELGVQWDDAAIKASIATEQYTAAGRAALRAGEEGALAGEAMAFSMREAKGELALLGEGIGITIPRHIRSFVAELPGVGVALNAAFSATAALFLIQILAEGANKLTDFIGATFLYTDANKEAYAAQVALNSVLDEQTQKIADLNVAYELIGLSGAAKTKKVIEDLTDNLTKANNVSLESVNTILKYEQQLLAMTEDAALAAAMTDEQTASMGDYNNALKDQKELEDKLADAQNRRKAILNDVAIAQQKLAAAMKLEQKEALDEGIKYNEALISAQKTVSNALNDLMLQRYRVAADLRKADYYDQLESQRKFDDDKYLIEEKALQDKLLQLKRDPTKNKDTIVQTNAELRALEIEHQAAVSKNLADFLDRYNTIFATKTVDGVTQLNRSVELLQIVVPHTFEIIAGKVVDLNQEIVTDATRAVDKVTQAYQELGIHGLFTLYGELAKAEKGYDDLKKSGVASASDILEAEMRLLSLRISINKQLGLNTTDAERALDTLRAKYDDLTHSVDKTILSHIKLTDLWKKEIPTASRTWANLTTLGKASLDSFAQAAEQAFASAILSEDTFGDALRKGTATVLAEIASRSIVYALYYTALGFAKLAEYDFAAASNAFTSAAIYGSVGAVAAVAAYAINPTSSASANASNTDGQPIGQTSSSGTALPAQAPIQTQNILKFASGALVSGPTLAVIGDAKGGGKAREAALPLDDPQAVSAIVEALGGGGDTYHVHVDGLISPDNLNKVMRQMNQKVKKGQANLVASNSYRITKRST